MNRPFYTEELAAAWMRYAYDMQFVTESGVGLKWDREFSCFHPDTETDAWEGHFYIHPDSLHLLEPQPGDLVLDGGIPHWCQVRIVHDDRIVIQRNSKPFFSPEQEG